MRLSDQSAFLLHRRPHGERSMLVELWTRDHGRLPAIARSVRGAGGERAATLAPFNRLQVALSGRGEVLSLNRWEIDGAPGMLRGSAALAGLYVNELLSRLLVRGDANSTLYGHYSQLMDQLGSASRVDWLLRRFEWQLLEALGYGFELRVTADGEPVQASAHYKVDLEHGVRRAAGGQGYLGATLWALASIDIEQPTSSVCNEQRKLLKGLFLSLLGGRGLTTWEWSRTLGPAATLRHPTSAER